ncbi:MAG: PEGA domain-containing protein, partial [Ignavibacteriales bacterium]|nr:PEGA domain-containing protein [Ignavibacteriales bacterium]
MLLYETVGRHDKSGFAITNSFWTFSLFPFFFAFFVTSPQFFSRMMNDKRIKIKSARQRMKILLFLLLSFSFTHSQELSQLRVVGKAELLTGEIIARENKDVNGEVCAGVAIVSDLTGLTFKSWNGIVKMNADPGRSLLFLSPTERVVEVYCTGYEPLKIILNEIDVKLKSGDVWQIKITGEKEIKTLSLNFLIEPTDADVTLDGKKLSSSTTQQVSVGKHTIKIEKQGFKTIEQNIDVSPTNTLFRFTLKEVELASVQIKSTPTGAKIFIENADKGETNKGIFLYPGTYKLKLTLAGYVDEQKTIEVKEGEDNLFTFTLTKNSGTLSLSVTPSDAEIKLNDQTSRAGDSELKPGSYTLEITKNGYLPHAENLEIKRGEKINRNVTLTKNSGTLSLSATPSDATVLINKESYTNRNSIELAPGKYKLEVNKRGYYDTSETVEITLGKTLTRSYTLRQKVGKMQFTVTPLEAVITLAQNGQTKYSWSGMKQLKDMPAGDYDLTATASGYKTKKKKITIEENKTTTEDVTLEKGSAVPEIKDNMIFVEGGTFEMGSNDGGSDEKPVHRVTVNDFYIGKYEVTHKEWKEIMGNNPSNFSGDNLPVENVSWNDIQDYLRKLNTKTGGKYRLPTEAEWEYAARGGNKSNNYKYSGSNSLDNVAWYSSNSNS